MPIPDRSPFARLANPVRDYAWGSVTAIPGLTGDAPTGAPQAELWMGAHPSAPSAVVAFDDDGPVPLDRRIADDPEGELGPDTVRRFGPQLPFLFKVLAAERALSLQVHPTLAQARAGFAAEEARGIPLDAAHRTFKDPGHKPELICALGDFEALCGFRRTAETARLLEELAVPLLAPWAQALRHRPAEEVLPAMLRHVLDDVRPAPADLAEVAAALRRTAEGGGPFAPACAAYARAARDYPGDPGLVAALLLNHVRLRAGQALFLDAGVPHAYLHGLGVELMANSDNVLRCGLTAKHIDVDGLLAVTAFRPAEPQLLTAVPATALPATAGSTWSAVTDCGVADCTLGAPGTGESGLGEAAIEECFASPAEEFRLSRLRPTDAPARVDLPGPQILLCTAGRARLGSDRGHTLDLRRGESAYLRPSAGPVRLTGPGAELFRATTGG
ncbi:mannose-6-phosphate isomerase, class I [Kitasatospora sp. NPDC058170]|uniref:mannose-6-phosphate isomerase, class I n=1 Tax=Kitasatospora sp. NPDC058170 TaxID=3346364 RepID=UPI0036DEEF35